MSESGVIGFIGGVHMEGLEAWRAGYEAGARSIDPDIVILSTYASSSFAEGFESVERGRDVALDLYQRGADVILHAAGFGSLGAIEAAKQHSRETGLQVWAIAPDSDWSLEISEDLQPYLLTSAIKKFDVAVYEVIRQYSEGELDSEAQTLTLADDAMGLASSEHLSRSQLDLIDALIDDVVAGTITIPRAPVGDLLPPLDVDVASAINVTWDGESCGYDSDTTTFEVGTAAAVELVNLTPDPVTLLVFGNQLSQLPALQLPSRPSATTRGHLIFDSAPGSYELNCGFETGPHAPWVYGAFISTE